MRVLVEPVKQLRPGKAQVYLRPEANRLLEQAIRLYGQPIYPTGSGSAGRTYEQQLHYWNVYQAGGPVASHPDHGPNPHRRYGALDIDDPNARTAMIRAGWIATTPSEWWHFEHPDCRTWPIVTDPYTKPESDDDMKLIRREGETPEWSLFHPTLRGPSDLERGYLVITDPEVAKGFARTWADGFGSEKGEPRDVYVTLQAAARWAYDRNRTQTSVDLGPVLTAVAQVPASTAVEFSKRLTA